MPMVARGDSRATFSRLTESSGKWPHQVKVIERFGRYFDDVSRVLAGERDVSRVFPNSSDLGGERERVFEHFLAIHLPPRCTVLRGGFVFDSGGIESDQIDLLVAGDFAPHFGWTGGVGD